MIVHSVLAGFWDAVVLFVSSCIVCTFFVPLSFSPLLLSLDSTLSLRSFIEARMASRNGPELACAHCSSMASNCVSSLLTVQFGRTVFVAGVDVNTSVAVLYCAVEFH